MGVIAVFHGEWGIIDAQQMMRRCKGTVKCFRKSDGKLLSSRRTISVKKPRAKLKPKPAEEEDAEEGVEPVDKDDE